MRKNFVKPMLKSYKLNKKENIVASSTWNDATMTATWKFHQFVDGYSGAVTHVEGCFDLLDDYFRTNSTILNHRGAWYAFVSGLTVYDNPDSPDHTPEAEANFNIYKGCDYSYSSSSS